MNIIFCNRSHVRTEITPAPLALCCNFLSAHSKPKVAFRKKLQKKIDYCQKWLQICSENYLVQFNFSFALGVNKNFGCDFLQQRWQVRVRKKRLLMQVWRWTTRSGLISWRGRHSRAHMHLQLQSLCAPRDASLLRLHRALHSLLGTRRALPTIARTQPSVPPMQSALFTRGVAPRPRERARITHPHTKSTQTRQISTLWVHKQTPEKASPSALQA